MSGVSIYSRIEGHGNHQKVPIERYINSKIIILENDFLIKLDDGELKKLQQAKSEYQVDRIARDIIFSRYNN